MGTKVTGSNARKVPYWLVALWTHSSLVFDADAHNAAPRKRPAHRSRSCRAEHGGVAAVQGVGPSWTLPTKLTLWPVPQR